MNGWLMSKDIVIAEIKGGKILPVKDPLLPLYFRQPGSALEEWLKLRSLDLERVNSRLVRRQLGLSDASPSELVMTVNAATITDTYWIKEDGDNLTWSDVVFQRNDLANAALLGSFSCPPNLERRTPELTNTGSFEKCWQLREGAWWLYKVGYYDNLFSEMAAYRLCERYGYPTAVYEFVSPREERFVGRLKVQHGIIRTRDFTGGARLNFEPAVCLGLKSSDAVYNYRELERLSPRLAGAYANLLTMDALVYNVDRHNKNFGVLRDVDTGEIVSLAPNYDNNISLLCGAEPGGERRSLANDQLLREWRDVVQGNLLEIDLPELHRDELEGILVSVMEDLAVTGCTMERSEITIASGMILDVWSGMEEIREQLRRFHNPGPSFS